MPQPPLVSVLIITYNSAEFISETLNSVLIQEYPNFEIIVSDDASNDETLNILFEYQNKYPSIFKTILNLENQGITKNSNIGLKACKGKYIAFLGGDDLMLPGKISAQVEQMEADDNCVISFHNADVFNSKTGKSKGLYHTKRVKQCLYISDIFKGMGFCACCVMARSSAIPKHGFDERIVVASDWLLWAEVLMAGGNAKYLDRTLSRYRRHQDNVTNKSSPYNRQGLVDHPLSAMLLLTRYPEREAEIISILSIKYRELRKIMATSSGYRKMLLVSLSLKFNVKSVIGLSLNIVSFGKLML